MLHVTGPRSTHWARTRRTRDLARRPRARRRRRGADGEHTDACADARALHIPVACPVAAAAAAAAACSLQLQAMAAPADDRLLRADLLAFLTSRGIAAQTIEHPAAPTVEEHSQYVGHLEAAGAGQAKQVR